MKKKSTRTKSEQFSNIGFALLLPGILLAIVLDENRIVQIIGVIFLLLSSAFFGASFSDKTTRKN